MITGAGFWMLVVETIAKIRRGYFVQGKAIKAISRELKVSRKVVRRVIRSGETAFVYERRVQPQPKLGPWREELERLLAANAAQANRERLTLVRLFEIRRLDRHRRGHLPDGVANWPRADLTKTRSAGSGTSHL